MDRNKQIDDIVALLDQFMGSNGGHMNIKVDPEGTITTEQAISKNITQFPSSDCSEGDFACRIPTLFEGLDDADDNSTDIYE